jgi:hypothetical protein
MDYCLAINQGLRRIKVYADRLRTRNLLNQAVSTTRTAYSAPARPVTPIIPAAQPIVNPAASRAATPTAGLVFTRPTYNDPCI